jgi:hypothetical protein
MTHYRSIAQLAIGPTGFSTLLRRAAKLKTRDPGIYIHFGDRENGEKGIARIYLEHT